MLTPVVAMTNKSVGTKLLNDGSISFVVLVVGFIFTIPVYVIS